MLATGTQSGHSVGGPEGGQTLPDEDKHHLLSNSRRRAVLERVLRSDEPVSLRDLSEEIATEEADETPPPSNLRRSVYISLHQNHLPRLDKQGVITYETDGKMIAAGPNAYEFAGYLDPAVDDARSTPRASVAVDVVALAVLFLYFTDILRVPNVVLAAITLAALAVTLATTLRPALDERFRDQVRGLLAALGSEK